MMKILLLLIFGEKILEIMIYLFLLQLIVMFVTFITNKLHLKKINNVLVMIRLAEPVSPYPFVKARCNALKLLRWFLPKKEVA